MPDQWPSSLPQCPILNAFTEKSQSNVIPFKPEVGPVKLRKKSTSKSWIASLSFHMNNSQLDAFKSFYETTIKDGTLTFGWEHPVTKIDYLWMFNERPNTVRTAPDASTVSFALVRGRLNPVKRAQITLAGSGGLRATANVAVVSLQARFHGAGNLSVTVNERFAVSTITLGGLGSLNADTNQITTKKQGSVTFIGSGALSGYARGRLVAQVRLSGLGSLYASPEGADSFLLEDGRDLLLEDGNELLLDT
jgi:hypothetical protein